jgi:hypothetical protein
MKKRELEKRICELEDQVVDLKARLDEVEALINFENELVVIDETPGGGDVN